MVQPHLPGNGELPHVGPVPAGERIVDGIASWLKVWLRAAASSARAAARLRDGLHAQAATGVDGQPLHPIFRPCKAG